MGVIIAVVIMLVAAGSISNFVNQHPTVKMLALSFLLLIGANLIVEALHVHIPKGYVYFAMGFSVFVELLNLRARTKKVAPVQLPEPYTDATPYCGALFPTASLDGYNYGGELTSFPIAETPETSWQDAATEELREFLGDLLLSIAADDTPMVPLPPAPVEPVAMSQPWHW